MAEVAILGMGRMGSAMARRVAAAGHHVTVWNRTRPAAEAVVAALAPGHGVVAATPSGAVEEAEFVLSMLSNGEVTCDVLLDTSVVTAMRAGALVCDLGTSGVAAAHRLADTLSAAGLQFVDAPVSGSVPAVEGGSLLVMASGDPAAVQRVSAVLAAFAGKVTYVGQAGAGQAMKLAVNLVVHNLNAAVSEALVLAASAGIARESAYSVLQDSVVGAPFVNYKRAAFLDPSAPVAMSLDLVLKDLRLITEFAQELGVPVDVTRANLAVVAAACDAGFGPQDMAALSRALLPADPA
jgi:3-hydroxyisobutyrate dehydrogenase-like beta-hydroxyacid dehydrogenase